MVEELIKKYRIELLGDRILVPRWREVPEEDKKKILELRQEILAELKRREEEERQRMRRHIEEAKEQRRRVIRGEVRIEVDPEDDTIYPYYAGELLAPLGLAREVLGRGYVLEPFALKTLGRNFTYPEALALSERKRKEEEEREKKKLESALEEARRTGKPVLIRKYVAPCNDPQLECSFDIVEEFVQPDGEMKVQRTHTY
jgi:hypothetical protein